MIPSPWQNDNNNKKIAKERKGREEQLEHELKGLRPVLGREAMEAFFRSAYELRLRAAGWRIVILARSPIYEAPRAQR